jgi:hypothetical protein
MSLEHDLRHALHRRQPAPGFDDRVRSRLAAAGTHSRVPPGSRWRTPLALAASILLTMTTAYYVRQRELRSEQQQRAATEQAARDVTLALRLTSETLETVRTSVREISHHER